MSRSNETSNVPLLPGLTPNIASCPIISRVDSNSTLTIVADALVKLKQPNTKFEYYTLEYNALRSDKSTDPGKKINRT